MNTQRITKLQAELDRLHAHGRALNVRYDRAPDGSREKYDAVCDIHANQSCIRSIEQQLDEAMTEELQP